MKTLLSLKRVSRSDFYSREKPGKISLASFEWQKTIIYRYEVSSLLYAIYDKFNNERVAPL